MHVVDFELINVDIQWLDTVKTNRGVDRLLTPVAWKTNFIRCLIRNCILSE